MRWSAILVGEDATYTKQYFTIGRQAHVRSSQSFGAPTLVWHVAFWPKPEYDPHNLNREAAEPITRSASRRSYNRLRAELSEGDLDEIIGKLQRKGRVPKQEGRYRVDGFGKPGKPADWESGNKQTPVDAFAAESIAFTIWWSDGKRRPLPGEPARRRSEVRVQADMHPDFATITFFIDAGKSWDLPRYTVGEALLKGDDANKRAPLPGKRRNKIFQAARTVKQICSERCKVDRSEEEAIPLETDVSTDDAKKLLEASNLLFRDIWEEFCAEFDCSLVDIAGETDKVFANFRGVVLSGRGKEPEAGKSRLSRFSFSARDGRSDLDDPYPNAVVRAYWPFIRRTRSEADHRDWIACGVFDWRALYVTALGGQSDFDPGDDARILAAENVDHAELARLDADIRQTADISGGYLPRRALASDASILAVQSRLREMQEKGGPEFRHDAGRLKKELRILDKNGEDLRADDLEAPQTPQGDRPAPFRYLFLTSGEPHQRQIGRMVDRVNLLGTVRLFAMKDFSIIRDADVHVRIYGQLLDQIMDEATKRTNGALRRWWEGAYHDAHKRLNDLWCKAQELKGLAQETVLRRDYAACIAGLEEQKSKCADTSNQGVEEAELLVTERPLMLFRRLLDDIVAAAPDGTNFDPLEANVFATARKDLDWARKAKSRHDEDMAQLNRQTDLRLTRIKTYIDELGNDAIGGLAFRINRAQFYAQTYRRMVDTLRVGSIDTWWDYKQLASRGVEPAFGFIESVGQRLDKLRMRLRDAMEAVQTSAIANQTEATRDNTFHLEVIVREIQAVNAGLEAQKKALVKAQRKNVLLDRIITLLVFLIGIGLIIYAFANGMEIKIGPFSIKF